MKRLYRAILLASAGLIAPLFGAPPASAQEEEPETIEEVEVFEEVILQEEVEIFPQEEADRLHAQQLAVLGRLGRLDRGELQESAEELTSALEVALEDLKRACQLDKKQVAKLQIAIKGAVEQHRREPKIEKQGLRAVLMEPAPEPAGEVPAAEERPPGRVVMHFTGFGVGPKPVTEEAIWVRAVKNVVSEEQRQAYLQVLEERARYRREAEAKRLVASLDRAFLFAADQRTRFEAVLAEKLAGQGIHQLEVAEMIVSGFVHDPNRDTFIGVFLTPSAEAKEILNETQWKHWTQIRDEDAMRRLGIGHGDPEGVLEMRMVKDGIEIVEKADDR